MPSAYAHPAYAASLAGFGMPTLLPESGGWLLERPIGDTGRNDAMGPYPLFACRDWSRLHADLDRVAAQWVSVTLVTDPFGNHAPADLQRSFADLIRPFKEHLVADLQRADVVSAHHRYYARRSLKNLRVEVCAEPAQHLDEWLRLYGCLRERHGLQGLKAFSRDAFAQQMRVPGIVMLRATALADGATVGAQLWYQDGEVAYSHLTAVDDAGYRLRASYALYDAAIDHFRGRVHWLDLGAGAGVGDGASDGLAEFKRGWANDSRTAYLCGRTFDAAASRELARARGVSDTAYFPAYRQGEFA